MGDQGPSKHVKLYQWPMTSLIALIDRPRFRLQSPIITFRAGAVLQPYQDIAVESIEDPYLPSGKPLPRNPLEIFTSNGGSGAKLPDFPTPRLYQGKQPVNELRRQAKSMKVNVPAAFHALPAISSRVRYHKSSLAGIKTSLVASLDLEMAPFSLDDIEITGVKLQLSGGTAVDLGKGLAPRLPLKCKPRDNLVFLYQLTLDDLHEDSVHAMARNLDITINASVIASKECKPLIQMHWKTAVDFSSALNPAYGGPEQPLQRRHKPSTLPVTGASAIKYNKPGPSLDTNSQGEGEGAGAVRDPGLTITFTAPPKVYVREPFTWEVLILNSSSKTQRLAITAVPRRSLDGSQEQQAESSSFTARQNQPGIASAMVDETTLYNIQKAAAAQPASVISLSTSTNTG